VVVVVVVGAAVVATAWMVLPLFHKEPVVEATGTPTPSASAAHCRTSKLPHPERLGLLAFVRDRALRVFDLTTCRVSVVVRSGAEAPVRFSADGRWIAFGNGDVVSASGGRVSRPLGDLPVASWEWSPKGSRLAGVTLGGGVVVGSPGRPPLQVAPGGSRVTSLAFAPDGVRLAVDRLGREVEVLDVVKGGATTVFRDSSAPIAHPLVAGWSPDGRWVLFWSDPYGSESRAAEGIPLRAVPSDGGDWVEAIDVMLPNADFVVPCGRDIAAVEGSGREVTMGKQILVTGPPRWRFTNASRAYDRSWIWPACSPDGRWIAATATPNRPEGTEGSAPRSLWVFSPDGRRRRRLTPPAEAAFGLPRWSSDGRSLLVIRRRLLPRAAGGLYVFEVDPASGKALSRVGPLANLGPSLSKSGRDLWAESTDWYRPG
jgi:dipeptidyl aminopeptidase/acylaminoacyl peptidase